MNDACLRYVELRRDKVADWDAYPFNIPAVAQLERLEFHPGVTFLIGENGCGKSTLIEAIAVAAGLNAEGGTKNYRAANRPTESDLIKAIRLVRGIRREKTAFFLRAETMFNVATEAEELRALGGARLHEMSHGESFLWLALNEFQSNGLYILDEPEAALSPQRQLSFLVRMHQLVRARSQFVIATHSPILMAYPEARIIQLDGDGFKEMPFEETEHYTVTRSFLENPKRMFEQLLDGELSDRD